MKFELGGMFAEAVLTYFKIIIPEVSWRDWEEPC